ncbi:MAG: hypothetical protein MJZ29_02255 [Bacteroidaceae bacterium]|nr:hypothetical protein [Bacteroidaceae bacterium]
MNKCFHCGNEDVELRTVSIDIAGEQIECLQCSESKSVILSKEDIMKINDRYGDAEEEIEELQNEVNNLRRAVDAPKEEPTDEDIDNYINSKI